MRQNVRKDTQEHWEFRSRYEPASPPEHKTEALLLVPFRNAQPHKLRSGLIFKAPHFADKTYTLSRNVQNQMPSDKSHIPE